MEDLTSIKLAYIEMLNEARTPNYYHTHSVPIDQKTHATAEHPIWLSHSLHQASGWHRNAKEDNGSAHTYTAKIDGKIARHNDPKVKELLDKHKIDRRDYHDTLTMNPEANEVHDHPATKLLKEHGYVGYSHPDYDPHDFQKDHDSTVVFHRKNVSLTHKKSS